MAHKCHTVWKDSQAKMSSSSFASWKRKQKAKALMFRHTKNERSCWPSYLSLIFMFVFVLIFTFIRFVFASLAFFATSAISPSTPKLTHWPSERYRNQLASTNPCVWLYSISVNNQFVRFVSNTNINISFSENEKKHIRDEIGLHTQVPTIFYSLHNLKKYLGFGERFIRVE